MSASALPPWAAAVAEAYKSGAASQFILHGNVSDLQLLPASGELVELHHWLRDVLLAPFDVVLSYDIGNGIHVEKGGETFARWPRLADGPLPAAPREAARLLTHYLRFCANLARVQPAAAVRVAVILRAANLIAPPSPGGPSYELSGIAWQLRDWACDPAIARGHSASFLLVENLNDLHPIVTHNGQAARFEVPLPGQTELRPVLARLSERHPAPLAPFQDNLAAPAAALAGATLHSVQRLLQIRQHRGSPLTPGDLAAVKKELVESDSAGLIEFVKPDRGLDDLHGLDAIKTWFRQDIALWRAGDLGALPMGYLICGPVGTGKTFLVECLAGEADVPVVKLRNFRDKWVGSTEGNLEKIFRLIHALGRAIVFIDEADQALGRRGGGGDSGVSGRVYGMMAEQMSDSRNRGRILWVLATSRPDLVEVDLKRPGRVDVKIPLYPTATPAEGWALIRSLCARRGLDLPDQPPPELKPSIPDLVTPGAAEAVAVKTYRLTRTAPGGQPLPPLQALAGILAGYQPPVPLAVLQEQIQLATAEATDLAFVPPRFH